VDAETGALTLFSRGSGVALVDAVAASCAVPGVWPPVAIGGLRYIDGGARSITNAHLAAGAGRVLIIQPSLEGAPRPWGNLDAEIAALAPAAVYVISADQASVDAFGANPLSPSTRAPGGPRRPEPAAPSAPLRPQDWRPCGNKLGPEHTTQSVPTWVAIDAARGSRVRSPGVTR
jgi:predicted acylesterase/phospholipase RssA